ncbi:DUF1080 domain-containing protein [Roseimaritima sediminicola]|uniref:DUF1080 domain-containing protein n=1 Tax=Roseimaritima sediminicola TaxID=2662066 RepID=UPI00129839D1|nr:family 16 glycoside hydrolase [Roseimaritima sediminicola]
MRTCALLCFLLALPWAAKPVHGEAPAATEDGFVSIFDGKTLDGWDGNPAFWSVQDGAITGITTPDNPTKGNTFLIWRGGETKDFELRLEYKIIGGNSGIQYRSFEVNPDKQKWVVGGYQGDFEAGKTYSGILYGEKFRGILANRGQKTELVRDDGKFQVKVIGSVGKSDEIQSKINDEDWNQYTITAKDFHFVHKINGVVTAECIDNDKQQRRDSGLLALQLHAGPPMKVQFRNIRIKHLGDDAHSEPNTSQSDKASAAKKKIAFLAGRPSHGYGAHEHYAGSMLLAQSIKSAMPGYEVEVFREGWPADGVEALADADSVVVYCDGGRRHLLNDHLKEFGQLMDQGVGLVCIHYAVETVKGEPGDKFLDWMGGYFEPHWSVNPHWVARFENFPDHPITRGVKPFAINDEWYYHMRFRDSMQGVTPILSDVPPEDTLRRPDGPHSGNPAVRKAVAQRQPQHVAWAATREDGGRGFGFTGGHFHWNWGDENFRKVVLNAIVWTAHGEVPEGGVRTSELTQEELEANQDEPKPDSAKKGAKKK